MRNSNETIGNQTHDFQDCNAQPQQMRSRLSGCYCLLKLLLLLFEKKSGLLYETTSDTK